MPRGTVIRETEDGGGWIVRLEDGSEVELRRVQMKNANEFDKLQPGVDVQGGGKAELRGVVLMGGGRPSRRAAGEAQQDRRPTSGEGGRRPAARGRGQRQQGGTGGEPWNPESATERSAPWHVQTAWRVPGHHTADEMRGIYDGQDLFTFLNPYNFVPLADVGPMRERAPSQEHFEGLSGTIVCRLETLTPFFTPDSAECPDLGASGRPEGEPEERSGVKASAFDPDWSEHDPRGQAEHKWFNLLRDGDGFPLIPGSSLKGVIRSAAEALSNSCLSVFDAAYWPSWRPFPHTAYADWEFHGYALRTHVQRRLAGRVASLREGLLQPFQAAVLPSDVARSATHGSDICDGDELTGLGAERPGRGKPIARLGGPLTGFAHITDVPEGGGKRHQRFLHSGEPDRSEWLTFEPEVAKAHDEAHKHQRDADAAADLPAFVPVQGGPWRRRKRRPLAEGDLVYYRAENRRIVDMGPVELYRVMQRNTLGDLLDRHDHGESHRPCGSVKSAGSWNRLCPSCRLFGWAPSADAKATGLGGRVYFGPAKWTGLADHAQARERQTVCGPLLILGGPKPQCEQMYLVDARGDNKRVARWDVWGGGHGMQQHGADTRLRGRKLYWHQPDHSDEPDAWYFRQPTSEDPEVRDDQNQSAQLLLSGQRFAFEVKFENLTTKELGLLLASLQPSLLSSGADDSRTLAHKIGRGKPIGLGSAQVTVRKLTLINRTERYSDPFALGEQDATNEIGIYVAEFAAPAGGIEAFGTRGDIADLLFMLDVDAVRGLRLQYPPDNDQALGRAGGRQRPGRSFEWFVANRYQTLLTVKQIRESGGLLCQSAPRKQRGEDVGQEPRRAGSR
jgi:hypothetical protein